MKVSRTFRPGPSWTDTRLVRACLDGNDDAWEALLAKYKNLVYSIPIKYGLPAEDAADIFQSVCVELLRELPRLREPRALAGWLIKVTAHKCFHWKRREARYVGADVEEMGTPPGDAPPHLDELLEEVEREQMVREALQTLSARCRALVEKLFFDFPPEPYAEVARKLGLARGSIGFIRRRCLDKLRRSLEEKGLFRP